MLKTIALIIAALVAAIFIFAATKPDTFRVERAISINAPAEKIFALINDFHQMSTWSPWEKIDPALQRTYSGAPSGKGAVYEWRGNKDIGEGRMEIVESTPPSKVLLNLHFIKPFEATDMVEFTLTPNGELTAVTQAMYGPSPYLSKLMTIFFSMEKMIGGKYEEGLANLKALAEK